MHNKNINIKKRKKPRIRIRRLLLVILIPVCLIAGISSFYLWKINQERTEEIETIMAARNAYEKEIAQTVCPDNAPQDLFEQIKANALACGKSDYEKLASFEGKDIRNYHDLALAAKEKNEAMESCYRKIMKNMPLYDNENYFKFMLKENDTRQRLQFMSRFDQKEQMTDAPAALSESLDEVPALIQWDDRWGYVPYGDWYIAFAGCGPTSISMIASYLKQDASITPVAVASRAMELDQYENGAGTKWSFYTVMADEYGLNHDEMYDPSAEDIVRSLQQGNLIILSLRPGDFTATGHFIVLTGLDENGQVTIHDPNSMENSNKTWDPQRLASQAAAMWSFWK